MNESAMRGLSEDSSAQERAQARGVMGSAVASCRWPLGGVILASVLYCSYNVIVWASIHVHVHVHVRAPLYAHTYLSSTLTICMSMPPAPTLPSSFLLPPSLLLPSPSPPDTAVLRAAQLRTQWLETMCYSLCPEH